MADTPESSVYRGREGTGLAQVFGQAPDPLAMYYKLQKDQQQQEAIAAEQQRLQKEKRDKTLWDLVNVNPDKAFAPMNKEMIGMVKGHRDKMYNYVANGGDPDDYGFKIGVKNGWDEINDFAARSNHIKDVIKETSEMIKDDPYLDSKYYFSKLNDQYLDTEGNALPLDMVDEDSIRNLHVNDPGGFNDMKYSKDWYDGMNDNMAAYINQKAVNNGILTESGQTSWKGEVYTPDPTSSIGVKVDAEGKPIINVTQDVVNSFLASPNAKRFYEKMAADQGRDVKDIVRERVAGIKVDPASPSFSRESEWEKWASGKLKPEQANAANRTFKLIGDAQNAFYDEQGNRTKVASPEARAAVGHWPGTRLFGGVVEEVELVPGTNRPGKSKFFGQQVNNSPNDRAIVKVKVGTAGQTRVEEVDLVDEGAPGTMWNMYRDSGYMGKAGKDIAFDQATEQLGIDPQSLYKGRAGLGPHQKAEQQSITNWSQGKDFGEMMKHSHQGVPIVKVRRFTDSDDNLKEYEITRKDGVKVKIKKDDYDSFEDIYRSGRSEEAPAVELSGGKKDTGVKWD